MPSVGVSLDTAIAGLQKNVDLAMRTASQLARDTEEITAETEKANDKAQENKSASSQSGGIDVFA